MAETEFGDIITQDPEMKRVLQLASNIALSRASVLICGESGTGKELLAKYIHQKSQRASKRFVAINCAAVPEGLLESELFGYEKGAFTGAQTMKPGKFELAHNSTFLLDEITEMPLVLQAKLLRVIQEGEVERLGAKQPQKINVRLIATTNRDLAEMVKRGEFRADLYYRLNVIPLTIPALKNRKRDIQILSQFFVGVSSSMNNKESKCLAPESLKKLLEWTWPGNIRELENVIERSVLVSRSKVIEPDDIYICGFENREKTFDFTPGITLAQAEKQLILKTLEHTNYNRTKAAQILDISIRTLRNKLHEYDFSSPIAIDEVAELPEIIVETKSKISLERGGYG
jgi:transcriptional regulator with PAS, ATPase and Fis domain